MSAERVKLLEKKSTENAERVETLGAEHLRGTATPLSTLQGVKSVRYVLRMCCKGGNAARAF